ncbi:MAG: hypothetical protein GY949_05450, partial [Gammaproteobacteria bacterium]|nr:hypothetical protein [Gammaproteobacteria bacterium]
MIGTLAATPQAAAQDCDPEDFPPPGPINITDPGNSIECVNEADRNNDAGDTAIDLSTNEPDQFIYLNNSGKLTVTTDAQPGYGINVQTNGTGSYIDVRNSGEITVTTEGVGSPASGISTYTSEAGSRIEIHNSGGVSAQTEGD